MWHFIAMKDKLSEGYHVHELYDEHSWTGPIKPYGESLEELIKELENMIDDLKTHGEYKDGNDTDV